MRGLIIVIATVVLITAWIASHHAGPTRGDLVPGIGSARAYCDTGQGFQPCAFVELSGSKT